jgi:hypothetical protein
MFREGFMMSDVNFILLNSKLLFSMYLVIILAVGFIINLTDNIYARFLIAK